MRLPAGELRYFCALLVVATIAAFPAMAQWVEFQDETGSRLSAEPALGTNDTEEKDYAWGDVDKDGDIDLVIVRKQDFTSAGKRVNVLLINEAGVLTDRTDDFAATSDVPGDLGFNTPTNDRDVILVDLDLDGWLDMVTAVTLSDGDPKHLGHPRIYMNLGCAGACAGTVDWLGFKHEDARIPTMLSWSGDAGHNPRFCSLAAGDLTGDGYPDIWFGDYDSGPPLAAGADFNDKLLINEGASNPGFFFDATIGANSHFDGLIQIPGFTDTPFPVSAFGASSAMGDMNGDGYLDIIKQTSLNNPLYVGIAYNDPDSEGFFDTFEVVTQQSPYFATVGDLNRDGKLDLVITDDGDDRYMLNLGNGSNGLANFTSIDFSYSHDGAGSPADDDGFGSNSLIVDLDNDAWNDVIIADVDVDIGGCSRRMHIYRNLGGQPGDQVILEEQTTGSSCNNSAGNPASCLVTGIPSNLLEGVHDAAIFDINGDGWKDMVLGRCSTTEVYMNLPPLGLEFFYPQGLPPFVEPGLPETFQVQLAPFGGATVTPGTVTMSVSINGGPFNGAVLTDLGGNLYEASLPAANCGDSYEFFLRADIDQGATFSDPLGAPANAYSAVSAVGTTTVLSADFEGDASAWTVVSDASLSGGEWQQAEPNGTLFAGTPAAPDEDADQSPGRVKAFVTENGPPGAAAADFDVDGGPTDLISPVIDLAGSDAFVNYSRWFFTSGADSLTVWITNNGSNWVLVETVNGNSNNSWIRHSFKVGDFITPTATVQIRFRTSDNPDNSVTEAGIDIVTVNRFVCTPCIDDNECDDDIFCNGIETCDAGVCVTGPDSCPGEVCDELGDVCVECITSNDCGDGTFCNGLETCTDNVCFPGGDPCPGQLCNEIADTCVTCLDNTDCDDAIFCNGAENCAAGTCFPGPDPCPGQICDEAQNVCTGTVALQPKMGEPLAGLSGPLAIRFAKGAVDFDRNFKPAEGLGPVFNQDSCGSCHNTPLGGSGTITVTRFGEVDGQGLFDPLSTLGGSLLQANAIEPACAEIIPPISNVSAERITPSILGFGLLEAIPDADIQFLADNPPAGLSGKTHIVEVLEAPPGTTAVGRFGWKSQVATVMSFSADAFLNEMGMTNRILPLDVPPNGDLALLAACDTVPADPEDGPDLLGNHFIDRVTDFQRFLAEPPQTPRSGMTGESLFNSLGCAGCHVTTFTTADDVTLHAPLRNKSVKPYSDFLLHDMGGTADQIGQGDALPTEIRTPPLWGARVRDRFWHDGRVGNGTFANRVIETIGLHDDPFSEAQASAVAFAALSPTDQDQVVAFLDSLGRAEFDFDGDNDVDGADWQVFIGCFSGPGSFYTPDDTCAIADIDQDGDVDDVDVQSFLGASDGIPAGEIQSSLLVALLPNGDVDLSWGASCIGTDVDYAIYVGVMGDYTSHTPETCGTGGATTASFAAADNSYFLVVPMNGDREGSYGVDGSGLQRQRSVSSCLPQVVGTCE